MGMRTNKTMKATVSAALFASLMSSAFAPPAFSQEPAPMRPSAWSDDKTDCSAFKKEPPWTIGVSNYSLGNSFRVQMFEELKFAAAKDSRIKEVVITEELILNGAQAILVYRTPEEMAAINAAAARETKDRDFGTGST